jgi:hypothetical protein
MAYSDRRQAGFLIVSGRGNMLRSHPERGGASKYLGGQRDVKPGIDPDFSRFGLFLRRDSANFRC